jgi:hypothetical protein
MKLIEGSRRFLPSEELHDRPATGDDGQCAIEHPFQFKSAQFPLLLRHRETRIVREFEWCRCFKGHWAKPARYLVCIHTRECSTGKWGM